MQRGVITFSHQEQAIIHTLLQQFASDLPLLIQKFTPTSEPATIELSSEEVEIVLDQLPIPSPAELEEISHIRSLLSTFLSPSK